MDNQNPNQTSQTNPAVSQPLPPNIPPAPNKQNSVNTTLVVLFLIFVYPIGLLFMWLGTKWPKWIKLLLTVVPILIIVVSLALVLYSYNLVAKTPFRNIEKTVPITTITPLVSESADETTNWKTHTNKQYGFSFKYPNDWEIQNGRFNDNRLQITFISIAPISAPCPSGLYLDECYPYTQGAIYFYVFDNPNNISIEDYITSYVGNKTPLSDRTISPVIVDSIRGMKTSIGRYSDSPAIYLEKNNKIYGIGLTNGYKEIAPNIFEKILSTYKFTQ